MKIEGEPIEVDVMVMFGSSLRGFRYVVFNPLPPSRQTAWVTKGRGTFSQFGSNIY